MKKLSVLIFSRNDAKNAIELVRDVYSLADEIVLVDSSDGRQRAELLREKRKLGLSKLRIFWAVALGYPEPLRMYALKKCRYEWVLLLDVDERLNGGLKRDVKKAIARADCDAFAIKRWERVGARKEVSFSTWQIRLFRRDCVAFRGMLHEQASVNGTLMKLEDKYCLLHYDQLRSVKTYAALERLDNRMSYATYNDRMLEYLSKLTLPGRKSKESSQATALVHNALLLYERLTLKNPDSELSDFDYFVYYFIRNAFYAVNTRYSLRHAFSVSKRQMKRIRRWRSGKNAGKEFELSKMLNEVGIIKFLGLDDENMIKLLNIKYKNRRQGAGLLVRLLKSKYDELTQGKKREGAAKTGPVSRSQ